MTDNFEKTVPQKQGAKYQLSLGQDVKDTALA